MLLPDPYVSIPLIHSLSIWPLLEDIPAMTRERPSGKIGLADRLLIPPLSLQYPQPSRSLGVPQTCYTFPLLHAFNIVKKDGQFSFLAWVNSDSALPVHKTADHPWQESDHSPLHVRIFQQPQSFWLGGSFQSLGPHWPQRSTSPCQSTRHPSIQINLLHPS